MNDRIPSSALALQVDSLLQHLAQDRDQRCDQLRAAADTQSREIMRSARAQARASVHTAVIEERLRIEQELRRAGAVADLEASRRTQRAALAVLEHMWAALPDLLETRWRDPAHRRSWIEAAVRQAAATLTARSWRIEHGAGWLQSDFSELTRLIERSGAHASTFSLDAGIRAGLKIRSEGVCLDATVTGLLASPADIEAAFLAEYLEAGSAQREECHS